MFSVKEFLFSVLQAFNVFYAKVVLFFCPEERPETYEWVFSGVPALQGQTSSVGGSSTRKCVPTIY